MSQSRKIVCGLMALLLATVACSLPGTIRPSIPPTPDLPELTQTATPERIAPTAAVIGPTETATDTVKYGNVNGKLSYPSEFIPPMRVFLYSATDFTRYYSVDTSLNQATYSIHVPEGTYFVVAYTIDQPNLSAAYTAAVPCGLSVDCNDHSLIPVIVKPDETQNDINPGDWYAPPGSFPPMP